MTTNLFVAVFGIVLPLGGLAYHSCSNAAEDPLFRSVLIESNTGLEVGRGFDVLTGNPRADCVNRTAVDSNSAFGPSSVRFRSIRIENAEKLDRTLGISASASVNTSFGGGGGSASFSNEVSVSSYSLNYVMEAVVSGKGPGIRDVKLKPEYKALIAGKNPDMMRFRSICGDGYIGEFTLGGEFVALVQIFTKSKKESEEITAKANASFGMASGSAAFANAVKSMAATSEVRIWTMQRGGGGPIPTSVDEIAQKVANLTESVRAAPTPTHAAIFSYITLMGELGKSFASFSKREIALSYLSDLLRKARDQQADAQYIFDHPSEFYSLPSDLPSLAIELQDLRTLRSQIFIRAEECVTSNGNCETVALSFPRPLARPARR